MSAPKVTPGDLDEAIVDLSFTLLPNGRTTVCQLTLINGFTIEGQSACVSLENYNAEIGNSMACEDAKKKLWQFLGFLLAERISGNPTKLSQAQ